MPATRTVTRTGSRQPTPRLHHLAHAHAHPAQAGPSNPAAHPIVLEDDEGPARTRRSVERKASKPRSQQKARAPPSSQPSEVIEISSDEDDAPLVKKRRESKADASRLLKAAQEENKRLKDQLDALSRKANEPALPKPLSQARITGETASVDDKLLSALEEHVTCLICSYKMWYPYTLACGHTFCRGCLQDWFGDALAKHLGAHPNYDAHHIVPHHTLATIIHPNIPEAHRRAAQRDAMSKILSAPRPSYSCPTCRVLIRSRPAENFVIKHVVHTVAGVQGEPCPIPPPLPAPGKPAEGAFDAFFPPAVLDMV